MAKAYFDQDLLHHRMSGTDVRTRNILFFVERSDGKMMPATNIEFYSSADNQPVRKKAIHFSTKQIHADYILHKKDVERLTLCCGLNKSQDLFEHFETLQQATDTPAYRNAAQVLEDCFEDNLVNMTGKKRSYTFLKGLGLSHLDDFHITRPIYRKSSPK